MVAHDDGSGERQLAQREMPLGLVGVSWSPDGKMIAATVFDYKSSAGLMSPVEFPVRGGQEHSLTNKRWWYLGHLVWLSDGRGLIVNTMELTSTLYQIGYLPYQRGEARRITTDTNNYQGISLTADSQTLASVQEKSSFNSWVARVAEPEKAQPITTGGGSDHEVWTPDGKVVFDKLGEQGNMNIWVMEGDGSKAKQLTTNAGRVNKGGRVSPDGRYIVFVSDRTGSAHIWRMDIDGNNLKQLTNSPLDVLWLGSPDCTPDGKWVVYTKSGADKGIWKVPLEGGDPVRLNDTDSAVYPAVSPDGKMLANTYVDQSGKVGVELTFLDGSAPAKRLDIASSRTLRWAPDSRSILYVKNENGVSNVWSQPSSGEAGKQITRFNSEMIRSFDLSRDGKQLIMSRGTANRDVVLIRDVSQSRKTD
jgi:Tol biopolymer transport system component